VVSLQVSTRTLVTWPYIYCTIAIIRKGI
jgi:hypothetical protein